MSATYILHASASKTIAAAGNYDAGDILSESATNGAGTAWEFAVMAPRDGTPGVIFMATIKCSEDSIANRFRLHLFNASPSTATEMDDNAAKTMDNDDRGKYLGYIDFPAMADLGEFSFAQAVGLNYGYVCADGAASLYGVLETLDAETNETASMVIDIDLYAYPA